MAGTEPNIIHLVNGGHRAPQTSGATAETTADHSAPTPAASAASETAHPALIGTDPV